MLRIKFGVKLFKKIILKTGDVFQNLKIWYPEQLLCLFPIKRNTELQNRLN